MTSDRFQPLHLSSRILRSAITALLSLAVAIPVVSQPAPSQPMEAPASPATQPAYPALEQLNAECAALYKQMQGNMLRVQMPASRWVTDAESRLQKYKLNSDVNRVLQQTRDRAARGNNYDYNQQRTEPEQQQQQSRQGDSPPTAPSAQPTDQQQKGQAKEELANNGKQGYTIIVPAPQALEPQQLAVNNPAIVNDGQGFLANSMGLLLNDQGHLLVPAYLDRESAEEQPIRLACADGEVIQADYVGSDQQTQLTVLKLKAHRPADDRKADAGNCMGQPVKLAVKPLAEGTLVLMVSPIDGSARLSVWNGGARDSGIVVTIDGKVAGIARAGQFLSASACRLIADQIMRHGAVRRATLGVIITQVEPTDPARQIAALGDRPAVRVDQVMKDSVAEKGGLQKGDLILSLAGEPVHNIPSLATAIAKREGVTPLKILRGDQVLTIEVDLVVK